MLGKLLVGTAAGLLVSAASYAGSLGMQSVSSWMNWEPDCYKPDAPYVHAYDVDSYNAAVGSFNRYVREVEDYLSCVEGEGENDLRSATNAISEGVREAQDDALNALDNARMSLESARIMLE